MSTSVAGARPRPVNRLWNRELTRFPSESTRYVSLGIVVLTTIVLYYQLYLSGGVATDVLRDLHMSFVYYVNISVVGYALGAGASVLAGLADRYGRANIVTFGLLVVGVLCAFVLPSVHTKLAFGIVYIAIGFVEGIILVATPALVRDFSPQLGRASAMGFWTLGPGARQPRRRRRRQQQRLEHDVAGPVPGGRHRRSRRLRTRPRRPA